MHVLWPSSAQVARTAHASRGRHACGAADWHQRLVLCISMLTVSQQLEALPCHYAAHCNCFVATDLLLLLMKTKCKGQVRIGEPRQTLWPARVAPAPR